MEKLPSINSLYWHKGNIKIMKTEAKKLRERIIEHTEGDVPPETKLFCSIVVGGQWYYKNGNIKKRDVLNLQKFLIDSVFKGLEADDKQIFDCHILKCEAERDWFDIEIKELEE